MPKYKMPEPLPDKPGVEGAAGTKTTKKRTPPVAFTNRPEIVGTEAAPGAQYTYRPEEEAIPPRPASGEFDIELPGPTGVVGGQYRGEVPELTAAIGEVARLEELAARPGPTEAIPARPAPGATISDFSHAERERFKTQIIQSEFGGTDPNLVDPEEMLQTVEAKQLPGVFSSFFQRQIRWQDRDILSDEQNKQWLEEVKRWRAYTSDKITSGVERDRETMDYFLDQWDRRAKMVKEEGKAPTLKPMLNPKGEWTYHTWDDKTRGWKDTGKGAARPGVGVEKVPDEVKVAIRFVQKYGAPISPWMAQMISINPKLANDPLIRQQIEGNVPKDLRGVYQKNLKIIQDYYGVEGKGIEGPTEFLEDLPGVEEAKAKDAKPGTKITSDKTGLQYIWEGNTWLTFPGREKVPSSKVDAVSGTSPGEISKIPPNPKR